jgi:hypothetical protein
MKYKYTKSYFLKEDSAGNPTIYGANGVEEFKKGEVRDADRDILRRLNFRGKTVLDLGFGRGEVIKYAVDMGAAKVVGIDFSKDAYAIAREFLDNYGIQADLYCDDALSFLQTYTARDDAKPFDIVLMLDFVEHVPRDELTEILKLMRKILISQSVVVINTPIYPLDNDVIKDGPDPRAKDTSDDFEETAGMHCNRYTQKSLRNYMRVCGLLAISGHIFVPALSILGPLEGSRWALWKAYKKGYPILVSALWQPEYFEFAFSWEDIRKRQNHPLPRALRFGKHIVRGMLRRTKNLKNIIYNKIITFCFSKMVKEQRYFDLWQSIGFHVIPVHYHQPIPDTRTLTDEIWDRTSELVGIDMNTKGQLYLLTDVFPNYSQECIFPRERTEIPYEFYRKNGTFLSFDAEVFHCMIRHYRPKRIVEVGSGSPTYLAARACRLNDEINGTRTELCSIDPFPNEIVKRGFPGLTTLTQKTLEQVEVGYFSQLEENDILYIDSSHVVGIGGDVNYEYLEIIPRLNPGVIIHVHDIFMPAEYPKKWIFEDRIFWTEQYILQAFLSFNCAFEILWASSYMHLKYPEKLKSVFPGYAKLQYDYPSYPNIWPSSFWFIRKETSIH